MGYGSTLGSEDNRRALIPSISFKLEVDSSRAFELLLMGRC